MNNYYNYPYQNYQQVRSNGSLIPVQSELEAQNYPVAPQTTVTFKNEREPYIYTKTVINPMQMPIFEKFRLVKEENTAEPTTDISYAQKSELEALRADFERLEKELTKNVSNSAVNANASTIKE